MKRTFIYFMLLIILVLPAFSKDRIMPPLTIPTAASSGFGGTHVAYTDNVFSLLVNPAAMIRVQQRSFFSLSPSIMNPQMVADSIRYSREAFSALTEEEEEDALKKFFGNMADSLGERDGKLAMGLDLREFPFSIAWVANGFGFGIWNRSYMNIVNIEGIWLSTNNYMDVVIPVGFAFKILELDRHTVDFGFTLKPFSRVMIQGQEIITALSNEDVEVNNWLNAPSIIGFGFDLGLLYRWNTGLSAGVTFTDIYTRGSAMFSFLEEENINRTNYSYYIPFAINMGLAYDFRIANVWERAPAVLGSFGITLALDWRNVTGFFMQNDYLNYRNTALDIGVGLQVSWLDTFKIRVGMNEMLPSVGLGLALGTLEIDLAYYGRELGREPGLFPTPTVDLTIAIRPKARERNWIWARRSIVGLITGIEAGSNVDGDFELNNWYEE